MDEFHCIFVVSFIMSVWLTEEMGGMDAKVGWEVAKNPARTPLKNLCEQTMAQ